MNLFEVGFDMNKIYFMLDPVQRTSNMNTTRTATTSYTYSGKFLLVVKSSLDQPYFKEVGGEAGSKYVANIEPLIAMFDSINKIIACSGHDVLEWSNVDATDALDANMDGLACSFRITVDKAYIPPVTDGGENPGGGAEQFIITNQLTGNYLLVGSELNLQIETNLPAISYAASFLPSYLNIDTVTGIISGTLPAEPGIVLFQIIASGANGGDGKTYSINLVDYDVNLLHPPFDLSVTGYNPPQLGLSFMLQFSKRYYAPQYERREIFIDGQLYRTFINGQPYNINTPGVSSDLMQRIQPPFEPNTPYAVKMRHKDFQGNYSDFSDEITVIMPPL